MFLRASKQKICLHFRYLLDGESKKNLTVFPNGAHNNCIITLSSNKLGNNFNCDTNLLMTMSSLLISNKKRTILQLVGY